MKIIERDLIPDKDGIPGYLAYPERHERGPALLLIHQNTGVTDYIKIEALKFAKLGYTTVVPNLYQLLGFPAVTHIEKGREIQARTSDADFVRVIGQGWSYLLSRADVNPSRVGVCGYCMGGRIGIHFLVRPRRPWEAAKEIRCPSIVLYGADDKVTTVPIQERVWTNFLANGQSLEWHFFPFGGHGFVDPGTAGYHPHSAELSWPLVCDFLARELDNPSP
jgi:carboxymethylenebutenolidase